jgi:HSP20 family protein
MPGIDEKHGGPLAASVEKLRHEFDHWLEAAVSQGERALDAFGLRGRHWFPPVDVVETPEAVLVDVDLPGVDPQLVDVTLAGNMLTLRGKRIARDSVAGESAHLAERPHGDFQRSIPMPAAVDAEHVSAQAANGVLHIRLAKTERSKPRHIRVNVPAPNRPPHPEL